MTFVDSTGATEVLSAFAHGARIQNGRASLGHPGWSLRSLACSSCCVQEEVKVVPVQGCSGNELKKLQEHSAFLKTT